MACSSQSVPPIQQLGSAVLLQGADVLRLVNFCLRAGVQKLHRDGLSPARVEELKQVVRRALMAASGHEDAVYVLAEAHSPCQDELFNALNNVEWWSVAEAADELGISRRQIRRIAEEGLGIRKGRAWMLPKARVLALKAEREREARNDSRHCTRAA